MVRRAGRVSGGKDIRDVSLTETNQHGARFLAGASILAGMLRIENLSKRYGDHVVFQGLSRTFAPGCYALCEEENTGKSTLLGIIGGAISPDGGDVWIDGCSLVNDPANFIARVSYVPDDCLLYPAMTGRQLLEQKAREKNVPLSADSVSLAYELGLSEHLDKRFEQMSTGTRRKVFLAAAALGSPAVIVADGPGDGLDAAARAVLARQFTDWSRDRVVLFASHDAELVMVSHQFSIRP